MKKRASAQVVCIVILLCSAVAISSAQTATFNMLASFDGTNGASPEYMSFVQGADGNLYGTTLSGVTPYGTVFTITPSGTLTTLHNFDGNDGFAPFAGLVLARDLDFYGTTAYGGPGPGGGEVFKVTASGTVTALYAFCSQPNCVDGETPYAGLVQGTDGNFYGTTTYGGGNSGIACNGYSCGTVFRITPTGIFTKLHSFNGTDGGQPMGELVQGIDGNFYGTTYLGGGQASGTIFKLSPQGRVTTLYNFCWPTNCYTGAFPLAGLVQGIDGNFYGTTLSGGANGYGTVFKITPSGTLTTLHSFNNTDGANPSGELVQGTDGNFYGTTENGGDLTCFPSFGCGTVFKIAPSGALTTLHVFEVNDGANPYGGLAQHTNGTFYGTTFGGGTYNTGGTVFGVSVGLGPFVETLPTSGKVGLTVHILGTNLSGVSKVSFHGTAAAFTVVSPTEINASLPNGATTGSVAVTIAGGGTLNSNKKFLVMPQITSFSPTSGAVGTVVTITGVSLTQTSKVTFGGVKATTFSVENDTSVKATVPTGAPSGKIAIATSGGRANSAMSFTVN